MGFFKEFKEFAMKGNVMDMAVGVIIGGAFGKIVTSLVDDVLMPAIGTLTGGVDFSNLAVTFGDANLKYGSFIQNIIDFLIIAFCIFLMMKAVNKLMSLPKALRKGADEEEAPTTKECPFCCSEIDIKATRCPHCTSVITEIAEEALKDDKDDKKKD